MTTRLLGLLLLSIAPLKAKPQAFLEAETDVLRAVDHFFSAMTARDSAAMASTLVSGGALHVVALDGSKRVQSISFEDYLTRLTAGTERLVERYWDAHVRIDGPIAVATMLYDFHIDGRFSHCGIDSFTLALGPGGWRIASVAYTRRTEGCPACPLGPLKDE
ncbi:MAG: nuclear transport factor 2 family protein [Flavobacteriales bacterium]|jgi:hypothetical protein|nr:nuclear transport factor 2 family protein [Flavobacteriales bacterium]